MALPLPRRLAHTEGNNQGPPQGQGHSTLFPLREEQMLRPHSHCPSSAWTPWAPPCSLAGLHQAYGSQPMPSSLTLFFPLGISLSQPPDQPHATSRPRPPVGLQLSLTDGSDEHNHLMFYDCHHHLLSLLRLKQFPSTATATSFTCMVPRAWVSS